MGTKLVFIVKFYLKCVSDNSLKEALKTKSLNSVKVLNLKRLEHEFSYSMWFDFTVMQFVADTADFPAICHVSDAKDITWNQRESSLLYKQFGKGIAKYNAFKQNFTLFCSTSESKGVSFTLWISDGEFMIGAMYCMLWKKLRITSCLKLQMCFTG